MPICFGAGARQQGRAGVGQAWLLVLAVFIGLLVAGSVLAAPPVPPAPDARVTDRVGVLSSATRDSLERRLTAYEQQSGHQIVVWIDESTGTTPIEAFAVEAFETWKLGRKQLDDGVGVFIMTQDRRLRIEVGYGLEPLITDLVAAGVIRSMIPAIERGEWDSAVVGGVEQLVDTIEGQPSSLPADPQANAEQTRTATDEGWPRILKIVGGAIAAIFMLVLFITNPGLALMLLAFLGRGGRGGGNGSGFGGGGGRSGGGGATGDW
jgi:uncharacterized protein